MRKPRLLLLALAAALLAGCIAAPPGSSAPPVSSPAPQTTVTPEEALAQKLSVPVTCDDGLTLVATLEEAALLDRLGSPEGSWFKPPVFVTDDRLLLPLLLPDGGSEWYLYEPKTDALTLLARLPEQCPTIPAAWLEGEQIRVVSAAEASPDGGKLFFGIIPYEGISDVVVLDLATGAAEVTPMQTAYPWYCWLGDQPCLVTTDEEQNGLLLRYGDGLASSFLWQPPSPTAIGSPRSSAAPAGSF